jgi:nucleoside-diphosphate-sugar epimerase
LDNKTKNKTVLVTGADGFIGRQLVAQLHERGIGFVAATRRQQTLCGQQTIAIGDIDDNTDWSGALSGVGSIVHLAGRAHILNETEADPEQAFFKVNAQGSARLASQAAQTGVQRFLLLSTIGVYGPEHTHLDINTPISPKTDYGRSKLAAEKHVRQFSSDTMAYTILRAPLVYGPGVGGRFEQLLRLCRTPIPLPLAGINNRRSLIYSENLVDLIIHALGHKEAANKTLLVSDGKDLSTPDLIRDLRKSMGQAPGLWPLPKPVLDMGAKMLGRSDQWAKLSGTLCVDSLDLRQTLDWTPPFSPQDGLAKTATWFKQNSKHR